MIIKLALLVVLVAGLLACESSSEPAPTQTPAKVPTAVPATVAAATPTFATVVVAEPTSTLAPPPTPTLNPTPLPPAPTATPTPKPSAAPVPLPTATPTRVPTMTPAPTPTPTPAQTPTPTPTPEPFALIFQGKQEPRQVGGVGISYIPYAFSSTGFRIGSLTKEQFRSAFEEPWGKWEYRGNWIAFMHPSAPSGTYMVALTLPDGRRTEATFEHEPTSPLPPLPEGTFHEFPDVIAELLARLPVPDGLRLYVQPQGCPSQHYPLRLSIFWGKECENTGGTSRPNTANYIDFAREVLLRVPSSEFASLYGTAKMKKTLAHEVCHAHQHKMIIDAGLSDPGLQQPSAQHLFELTPEGAAFFAAAGWQRDGPEQYSGGAVDEPEGWKVPDWAFHFPHEDFAEVCALWYVDRDLLRTTAPLRYEFAQEWLGRWVK